MHIIHVICPRHLTFMSDCGLYLWHWRLSLTSKQANLQQTVELTLTFKLRMWPIIWGYFRSRVNPMPKKKSNRSVVGAQTNTQTDRQTQPSALPPHKRIICKAKHKYTNPAYPVRNFCEQKLRPLPILFWTTEKDLIHFSGIITCGIVYLQHWHVSLVSNN